MGRRIPLGEDQLIHPMLSLSVFAAGMAATIAIITGVCGVRFRRRSSPNPSPNLTFEATKNSDMVITPPLDTANIETTMVPPALQTTTAKEESEDTTKNKVDSQIKELPLPPAMKTLRETYSCNYRENSASSRKLDSSLSMKVARSMSVKNQEEKYQRKKGKLNSENSLWSKPIILGEKCKVPDEDDAIIYDNKGNRISTYHKKTTSSISLSRQTSYIDQSAYHKKTTSSMSLSRQTSYFDQSAIPSQDKGRTRKEGENSVDNVCY